jgi:hypothetical protein
LELWRQAAHAAGPPHPIQVIGDGGRGLILTVQASDVNLDPEYHGSRIRLVKKALRKAIEPVTGDAVFVERWETVQDAQGNWPGRSGRGGKTASLGQWTLSS